MRQTLSTLLSCVMLSTFITACTTFEPASQHPPFNQKMSWNTRRLQLSRIKNWKIKAALAIRVRQKAESIYLNWEQNRRKYQLTFFGPLGIGATTIHGQPGQVSLELPNHQNAIAKTPEQLLAQHFGWNLPVSNLRYWIRGLPVPHHTALKEFDAYHHLTQLEQDGWIVEYQQYMGVTQKDLPHKIFIHYPNLTLHILINDWKL